MGLRRHSIRLRIFLLVLIPLLSLIGLYIFVAGITIGDAVSTAHATSLKNDTGQPIGNYEAALYAERRVALLYLATPGPQTQAALAAQEAKSDQAVAAMRAAVTSNTTMSHASTAEKQAIGVVLGDASSLQGLRSRVSARAIGKLDALHAYSAMVANTFPALLQVIFTERNTYQVTHGTALVQMGESEDALLQEDALVEADLAARSFSQPDRHMFAELVGERRALQAAAEPNLSAYEQYVYGTNISPQTRAALTSTEDSIIADTHTGGPPPVQPAVWGNEIAAVSAGFGKAAAESANDQVSHANDVSRSIYLRLFLAGGLGLLAVLVSVFASIWIGRGLVRQLAELRRSALTLASERLPQVVRRLKAGEDVDVSAEAPPMEPSEDEIGQVSQAFNQVQRTAIEATVDQARLRRGVSDVFRNLARRSQSLLHRQLSLLDAMERRANDPDELSDLYRLDHLTTRMRRHAEGLIILSGAAPGRSWRNPVRLVDVLRASVAEIEDYTRVTVVTMTQAALAGPAVADVIHMIAELVENATLFSPPNTPVRLMGDIVGKGFAVEIEDRGLGLSAEKLADINDRLANPPEFDLSDSDQLGLFVAARLAKRHRIKISLRPNPYGGTTAIVLIPHELVVPEEVYARDPSAVQAGEGAVLPTGRHAARTDAIITDAIIVAASQPAIPTGTHPYETTPKMLDPGSPAAPADAGSAGAGQAAAGPGYGGLDHQGLDHSGHSLAGPGSTDESFAPPGYAGSQVTGPRSAGDLPGNGAAAAVPAGTEEEPSPPSPGSAGDDTQAGDGSNGAGTPGSPAAAGAAAADQGSGPGTTADGEANSRPPMSAPTASWFQRTMTQAWPEGDGQDGAAQPDTGAPTADLTELGLPRRVRQANLAPQLRNTGAQSLMGTDEEADDFPSPEEARATMTAIQRGWERGRSAFAADAEPAQADMAEPNGSAAEGGSEQ